MRTYGRDSFCSCSLMAFTSSATASRSSLTHLYGLYSTTSRRSDTVPWPRADRLVHSAAELCTTFSIWELSSHAVKGASVDCGRICKIANSYNCSLSFTGGSDLTFCRCPRVGLLDLTRCMLVADRLPGASVSLDTPLHASWYSPKLHENSISTGHDMPALPTPSMRLTISQMGNAFTESASGASGALVLGSFWESCVLRGRMSLLCR
mmetsp:Transcript_6626/g.16720  ORF Transcript_6626/g.16720 Transcript_6626/m.16720 type:complete len:208 (-) Transcript_6626:753-1376(-)